MKQLNPYLTLFGNCKEALNFYKQCLDGKIVNLMPFEGSPFEVPEDYKNKVMHAEFKADGIMFMASDGMPDQSPVERSNIALSLNFSDLVEQEKVFNALAEGGTVTMALEDTFWGAKFGMLTDQFGIEWMLNCNTENA